LPPGQRTRPCSFKHLRQNEHEGHLSARSFKHPPCSTGAPRIGPPKRRVSVLLSEAFFIRSAIFGDGPIERCAAILLAKSVPACLLFGVGIGNFLRAVTTMHGAERINARS